MNELEQTMLFASVTAMLVTTLVAFAVRSGLRRRSGEEER